MYHVNGAGDIRRCGAEKGQCPFGIHGETVQDVEVTLHQENLNSMDGVKKHREVPVKSFTDESYYGDLPPRSIQIPALNDVTEALEEGEATQLVAACGTGKTFMHRQLLNHQMNLEGANGVGIILTSGIKLAHDTAADLRPIEAQEDPETSTTYDKSFGVYGKDYEIVEVHSDARPYGDKQSVLDSSTISVDRIYQQIADAKAAGKKVVIVSTYDSVGKVQEAQARFANQAAVEADLLIHDEAHNIIGQQKPSTVAGEDNELTAYVGFHNDIPGSLQARKRLYSTATPVLRETDQEKEPVGSVEEAKAIAEKMRGGDQFERVTVYADHPLVGGVSGFISQHDAVANGYLAEPTYEVRQTALVGSTRRLHQPAVNPDGTVVEKSASAYALPLKPATYGALNATLDAMVADPQHESDNTSTNALAYVGSIPQAEAYKAAFREVALHRSGNMDLEEAQKHLNSPDEELKRRARYRLLAEHAEVKAAHSSPDPEAIRERKAAFAMFRGNAAVSNEWTPHKRVLANVDIFSEGVSIPEIDTVVISDDNKLNEKAMTQAVGRAIRTVPHNDHKRYGRVIIPSVTDADGANLTESSVNMATYTATRVERSTAATRLRGEIVPPDDKTTFRVFKADGTVEEKKGREFAQEAVTDLRDLAVSTAMTNAHINLRKDHGYANASPSEKFQMRKSYIYEQDQRIKKDTPQKRYIAEIKSHLEGKSAKEVSNMDRNGRVIASALANGDPSSIHPEVAKKFIDHGVLRARGAGEPTLTKEDKRKFLLAQADAYAYSVMTRPADMLPEHSAAREKLASLVGQDKNVMRDGMKRVAKGGPETPATQKLNAAFSKLMEDDEFVDAAFQMHAKPSDPKKVPLVFNNASNRDELRSSVKNLWEGLLERKNRAAQEGSSDYEVNREAIKSTGGLTVATLRKILAGDL